MPHFYFHMRDGDLVLTDPEGIELANLNEALREAVAGARGIIADDLKTGGSSLERQFEIADQDGKVMAILRFKDAIRLAS